MKRIPFKIIVVGAVTGMATQLLCAQTDSSSPSSSSSKSSSQEVRISKVIGADLKTSSGEDLGEIKDLVVDPQSGKVNFAIVGVDVGNGTQALAPIPWQAVNLQVEKNYVASIDRNKLKSGPTLSEQQWDKLMQPDYVIQIYKFYGMQPPATGGSEQEPGGSSSGSGQQNSQGQSQ